MNDLEQANQTIRQLEAEVKDLTMRLSAIKVITTKVQPVCANRMQRLLEECELCGEESGDDY